MLGSDPSRAFYGPGHVLAAAELGAIQTLLISGVQTEHVYAHDMFMILSISSQICVHDSYWACHGPGHVPAVAGLVAIQALLIRICTGMQRVCNIYIAMS